MDNARIMLGRPTVFLGRRSYILILSHMRSYSSLLSHILGSHRDISGYAEMHVSYKSPLAFLRLRSRVFRSLDCAEFGGFFVLDKVLHNEYTVPADVIEKKNVFPIFLVRAPRAALSSISNMGGPYSDHLFTSTYYADRLRELSRMAQEMTTRGLLIKSEDLLGATTRVLEGLEQSLGLREPLTDSYRVFSQTGQRGRGDTSSAILEGRIVREPPPEPPEVEREALARGARAYRRCLEVLEKTCITV